MRRRYTSVLVEMTVMLAVFTVAAALCMQAFARAEEISRRSGAKDRAVTLCQSVAEVIRQNGGDLAAALTLVSGGTPDSGEDGYAVYYGTDWALLPGGEKEKTGYTLRAVELENGRADLGKARVETLMGGESLFSIEISWQKEVGSRG